MAASTSGKHNTKKTLAKGGPSTHGPKLDMEKGGPSREERTARRVTWTCQEGSGSLLGNFARSLVRCRVSSFILDRFLG
jgi:hypothetical protein